MVKDALYSKPDSNLLGLTVAILTLEDDVNQTAAEAEHKEVLPFYMNLYSKFSGVFYEPY